MEQLQCFFFSCFVFVFYFFAYLNVIGLIGGHAANEFVFSSPQSHTAEVKNDQITPVCCCV